MRLSFGGLFLSPWLARETWERTKLMINEELPSWNGNFSKRTHFMSQSGQAHLGKNCFDSTTGADVPGSGRAESPLSPTLRQAAVSVEEGVALPSGVRKGHLDSGVSLLERSVPCAQGPRL